LPYFHYSIAFLKKRNNVNHNKVRNVSFSPDGQMILSCSKEKSIRLWDVESGKQLQQFNGHSDVVKKFFSFQIISIKFQ